MATHNVLIGASLSTGANLPVVVHMGELVRDALHVVHGHATLVLQHIVRCRCNRTLCNLLRHNEEVVPVEQISFNSAMHIRIGILSFKEVFTLNRHII